MSNPNNNPPDPVVSGSRPSAGSVDLIRSLYRLVVAHHDSRVMRNELCICPICEGDQGKAILDAAWNAMTSSSPNTEVSDAARPGVDNSNRERGRRSLD